jgi:hypothetical protein
MNRTQLSNLADRQAGNGVAHDFVVLEPDYAANKGWKKAENIGKEFS